MTPFDYPAAGHQRKHGPQGYADYERFRPWLRDEFAFRCVYCLLREQWIVRTGGFAIEHFLPVSRSQESSLDYDNLLYACSACNLAKAAKVVPDPTQTLTAADVRIHDDGRLEASSDEARAIVRALGLDDPRYVQFRRRWIRIVRLAQSNDSALLHELMGLPDDLPDLSRLRPPGGNLRPEGVEQSHFARRELGQLQIMC